MKKVLAFVAVLALALSVPALAGDTEGKNVKLTGWITDEYCGAKNANAEGAGCAKACAKKGAALMIYADGKLYKLSDKELAGEHVGHEVVVTGTVGDDNVIQVTSIEEVKEG